MDEQPPRRKRVYDDGFEQEFDGDMKRSKRFHDDVEPTRGKFNFSVNVITM